MEMEKNSLFIGGHWVEPASSRRIRVICPSTEEVVATVPEAVAADMDRAVGAAREAFDRGPWRWMSPLERADRVRRIADHLAGRAEEVARLITLENGSPIGFARQQALGPVGVLHASAELAARFPFSETCRGLSTTSLLVHEPVGVVAAIVPWNGPLYLAVSKLAPALCAGCTVVLKPAIETPLDACVLSEACEAAGLPDGVVSIVPGGREAGQHLVEHPGIDKVTFTGSVEAGRKIMASCALRMTRLTLELGGKSAAIVLSDVDVEAFIAGALAGMTMNSGQACALLSRVIVPRSRQEEIVTALSDAVGRLKMGDPFQEDTALGPLISSRQRDRVEGYIDLGRREGATIAAGGGRPGGLSRGWYVEPTIFVDVENSMRIAQEEIFGPVLCVIPYDDEEEAIGIANDSRYGLHGAVFTSDMDRGFEIGRRIRTGSFTVNGFALDPAIPFGGFKESGIGREGGVEGFRAYLETKALTAPEGYEPDERWTGGQA